MILYKKILIDTNSLNYKYLYNIELVKLICKQINDSVSNLTNLGLLDFPENNVVSLSEAAFRYSNPVVQNGILYVDIETITTPNGIIFRNLIDSGVKIEYKPAGSGSTEEILDQMGVQHTRPDLDTYKFIAVCGVVSSDTMVQIDSEIQRALNDFTKIVGSKTPTKNRF